LLGLLRRPRVRLLLPRRGASLKSPKLGKLALNRRRPRFRRLCPGSLRPDRLRSAAAPGRWLYIIFGFRPFFFAIACIPTFVIAFGFATLIDFGGIIAFFDLAICPLINDPLARQRFVAAILTCPHLLSSGRVPPLDSRLGRQAPDCDRPVDVCSFRYIVCCVKEKPQSLPVGAISS
jgi:hypothetical protein